MLALGLPLAYRRPHPGIVLQANAFAAILGTTGSGGGEARRPQTEESASRTQVIVPLNMWDLEEGSKSVEIAFGAWRLTRPADVM